MGMGGNFDHHPGQISMGSDPIWGGPGGGGGQKRPLWGRILTTTTTHECNLICVAVPGRMGNPWSKSVPNTWGVAHLRLRRSNAQRPHNPNPTCGAQGKAMPLGVLMKLFCNGKPATFALSVLKVISVVCAVACAVLSMKSPNLASGWPTRHSNLST